MYNIEWTEDNPQECSRCGDEACFDKACEKEVEMELCKCGATMAKIYSQGEFKRFCPVCRPDPFDRAEDQRMDVMDIQHEMEVDDGFSN